MKPMSPEPQVLTNSVWQTYHFTHRANTRLALSTPCSGPSILSLISGHTLGGKCSWAHFQMSQLRLQGSLKVTQFEVGLDLPPCPSLEEPPP